MNIANKKEKLNIFKIFINGINLIEASAGTGKTFTIVLLYLRLLLGIEKKKIHTRKFLVHEILVVTFTNSAKEELYIRIKEGIENLYLTCINKKNINFSFDFFLKEIKDIDEAIYILKKAQNDINNSSIYTIHSFCQHILQLHTLHLNFSFEDKIIENEDHLYLQATQDFWRRSFYNLPENIINIIYKDYKNPDSLLKKIKPFFHMQSINFNKKILNNKKLIIYHQRNIQKIIFFKEKWLIYNQIILKEINILKINKKIYNNFNLSKWINNITIWAKSETKDYTIPVQLKYFSKKNIKKNTINNACSKYIIFEEIEKILKENFSLKNIIIIYAIKKINKFLLKEKKKKSLIGFNDLLSILLKTIKKEKNLRNLIRKKYPVAFIDEFQDTDIQQYKIFNLLYKKSEKTALFLIGDPKQAIYSFRGADVFSYLYAKSKIKKYYYLDTNWRSSINMCRSVNFLFSQYSNPFILKDIPFIPIKPSSENSHMNFTINGISQIPMTFFFQEKKEVDMEDYQVWISKQCANEISCWLNYANTGQAKITIKNREKNLTASDIAILVRNKKEAGYIQKELETLKISSIYSSNKNSVFQTFDAQELLLILESILEPDNEQSLRKSISTHIFQKLLDIVKKKSIKKSLYFIMEKLYEYYDIWKKVGIFHMIKAIILEYQINSNAIEINQNYIKNLNFLHIAELLQEQFQFLYKKTSLIRWFQKKILQKTQPLYNEYIRYINESQSVKIITIHKSKGLEYPIVWIPFGIDFKKSRLSIYHNQKNFKIFFDVMQSNENIKMADKERLAEDIRFLYVALTRSILHCSIGIACLTKKIKKNTNNNSAVHKSGLGYTIQCGKPMNYENLFNQLKKLSINNLIEVKNNIDNFKLFIPEQTIYLIRQNNYLNENIKNIWNITSFTQLNKENQLLTKRNQEKIISKDFSIKIIKKNNKSLTIHNFPKGKNTGLMIHYILKHLNFLNKKNYNWFSEILEKYNISLKWTSVLISWVKNIINTPLYKKNIILSEINEKKCIKELEFFFPIKNILYSTELNKIIQSIDPISTISPKLLFNPVKGILKGFIDLVFIWKKKYYILDYKSNWLGKNNSFYSNMYIKKEIIKKRYDLQYQIYTIAIHKYLQKKIKKYNYKDNFGGIFYIFLRAMDHNKKNNGIFYTIPDYSLIEKTIHLIS
ncbi:MAG: exodeoxyribonuclease V subunit beta [Buchnera aphidicola (Acyrthosiphon caraganae)]|nr:MAG: exodeoxyribonuclease V subunit beta [Buchnera aphidicola (Acyrthosiphon caraganae)]